jgi:hypothetical protein
MSRISALQISSSPADPALTPQQKQFNSLLQQIEKTRQTLAAWHEQIDIYRQAHVQLVLPMLIELMAARRQWLFALDALHGQRGWSKVERETIRDLVSGIAGDMLDAGEDDAELKALFDKHADFDFDTERQASMRAMKGLTEAMTGLDLGDDEDLHTDADLRERVERGFQERAAAEEAERVARSSRRRKTAAQQRREDETQQATQSVREIYRKLASALHPDRETDAEHRDAKTDLMKRANQAYAAGDLLTLLELQLQIEQIDAGHIAGASVQRLKQYNKVLSEQLAELKGEIVRVQAGFEIEMGVELRYGMNPRKLGSLLAQHKQALRADLEHQRRDLRVLADVAATKRWLKRERQAMREAEFDPSVFF